MRLILAFHHHQPLGQLPWVVSEVVRDCYDPLLKVLLHHPTINITLHYSGPLLDMLAAEHPSILEQAKVLLNRGQAELMGGARWEAILPIWPSCDQLAQLRSAKEQAKVLLENTPDGMWLPERVWEPSLSGVMLSAGYCWSMLDENGLPPASVQRGWHQIKGLTLFSIDAQLRQLLPWRPVTEIIEYLRHVHQRDAEAVVVFADDAEKFGSWPGTYSLVYEKGYLEDLLAALEENADWLQTVLPSQCLPQSAEDDAEMEIPSTTYPEMLEWSGGNWRHFLERYPESYDMQQAVLDAPSGVARLAAQCNDAYWHGVFGGLFLPHLRQAVYRKVAQAINEKSKDAAIIEVATGVVKLQNSEHLLRLRSGGGQLFQWIDGVCEHNWLATLRHYGGENRTDWYARGGGIEHFLGAGTLPQDIAAGHFTEEGDFASEDWEMTSQGDGLLLSRHGGVWHEGQFLPLHGSKRVQLNLDGWEVKYRWHNPGERPLHLWWGSEWNLAPSGDSFPARSFQIAEQMLNLQETHACVHVNSWQLEDRWLKRKLMGDITPGGSLWLIPFRTVSRQEGEEFESIYQQSIVLWHRQLWLQPGETTQVEFNLSAKSLEDKSTFTAL